MTTISVNFTTPIRFDQSGHQLFNFVEDYFYLGGKRAFVQDTPIDGKRFAVLQSRKQNRLVQISLGTLKVATYLTGVCPLIMLIAKAILRSKNPIYLQTTYSQQEPGSKKLFNYKFKVIDLKQSPYKEILQGVQNQKNAIPILIHLLALSRFDTQKLPQIKKLLSQVDTNNESFNRYEIIDISRKFLEREGQNIDESSFWSAFRERIGKIAYHGTSEAHLAGISENGLSPDKRAFDTETLNKIITCFQREGIRFLVYNTIVHAGGQNDNQRVCVTALPKLAFNYALRSPEWFTQAVNVFDLKREKMPEIIKNFEIQLNRLKNVSDEERTMMRTFVKQEAEKYVDQRAAVVVVEDLKDEFLINNPGLRIGKDMPIEASIVHQYLENPYGLNHLAKNIQIKYVILA